MAGESSLKLRLSIWRDFVPDRALILRRGAEIERRIGSADSDLQEEVYSWQMREGPFDGISDENVRSQLRKILFEGFDASQPPAGRRLDAMKAFLVEADRVINEGHAEWTVSHQDAPDDDGDPPHRLNPLLALKLHLEWLANVFDKQPGISVSIR